MLTPSSEIEPVLAPPGAGLPRPELLAARMMFAWHRLTTSRARRAAAIMAQREALVALARACDPATGARRVLIPRLRGLEDSSRYWSVYMTLDHLRIVNANIARIIGLLARDRGPEGAASTAAVKPSPAADAAVIGAFAAGCDELTRTVAAVADLRTARRFAHPWFGPLDAAGWHAMAGFHLELHQRQARAILARAAV
jgi:hypothetical protein